jgi:hypothetical protein
MLIKDLIIAMKNRPLQIVLSLLFTLLTIVSCSNGGRKQTGEGETTLSSSDTASIVFTEYVHDFGKVISGEKVAYTFSFENRGNAPLVISQATTTCGCTVSKYSRKPVSPGGSGTIEVIFDSSDRSGRQSKIVTVRSNATKSLVLLRITGEVINNNNN